MKPDFSGWATKADVECSDGLVIDEGAFKHQDSLKVPLVWQHGHDKPENVLGHALLTYKQGEGVWADAFFNATPAGKHMKESVQHGDVNMMSIWANQVRKVANRVIHGAIREVSLVLRGANPGAKIENVMIEHSDGSMETYDDAWIITTGLEIKHADEDDKGSEAKEDDDDDELTVQDIVDGMTEEQKVALTYIVEQAVEEATKGDKEEESKEGEKPKVISQSEEDSTEDGGENNNDPGKGTEMGHTNVFEKDGKQTKEGAVLSHSDFAEIASMAVQGKADSLKQAVIAFAEEKLGDDELAHGIQDIGSLFPEAKALTRTPEWENRDMTWVGKVLGAVKKSPFSRIKTWTADLTYEEARAKGYVTGALKKEQYFTLAKRTTEPTTIYKKQKLDRDDILDITDFDVVRWMQGELRVMLDEEIARAVMFGDGRSGGDPDKINETKIRPIASDDPFYTLQIGVNLADESSSNLEVIEAVLLAQTQMKGTGVPKFYTSKLWVAQTMLLKDETNSNRRLFNTVGEIASAMMVDEIVVVDIMDEYPDIVGVVVNLRDYTIGADKGGNVTLFDDFDIDYNQYKYLIETRISGALTKPRSALVVSTTAQGDTAVVPDAPTQSGDEVTIPTQTGVVFKDGDGVTLVDGSTQTIAAGEHLVVQAFPDTDYYFPGGHKTRWSFMYNG